MDGWDAFCGCEMNGCELCWNLVREGYMDQGRGDHDVSLCDSGAGLSNRLSLSSWIWRSVCHYRIGQLICRNGGSALTAENRMPRYIRTAEITCAQRDPCGLLSRSPVSNKWDKPIRVRGIWCYLFLVFVSLLGIAERDWLAYARQMPATSECAKRMSDAKSEWHFWVA